MKKIVFLMLVAGVMMMVGCKNGTSGDESVIDEDVFIEEEAVVDEELISDDEYATIYGIPDDVYVDLGLPSGTKWKTENEGMFYNYDDAVAEFGKKLPTKGQWEELRENCKWVWVDGDHAIDCGIYVEGPNGKRIFLRASGWYNSFLDEKMGVGTVGCYWSSTYFSEDQAWGIQFEFDDCLDYLDVQVCHPYRAAAWSVRLVKN